VSVLIRVMCVILYTVLRAVLYNINAYIGVRAIIHVMCVIRHAVFRAVL